jgi:plasmid stabilization system protein ParE
VRQIVVAPQARRDFKSLLAHSRVRFGPEREQRYRALCVRAFVDLRDAPDRRGAKAIGDGRYLYPLRFSRNAMAGSDRVARPRHVIVYRFDDAQLQILALLHEAMDLPTRLR